MISTKKQNTNSFDTLKDAFHYKNKMQAPKLTKVVINTGVGSFKDKKKIDLVQDRLVKIAGQKPVKKGAKVSISAFKVREGDPVAFQVTLRGNRMFDFLDRLLNIALPRTKDFRGLSPRAIDSMGNYTIGIREHIIFPETADEDLKDVFGLAATVVTTAHSKEEAKAFLEHLGFPFKKKEEAEAVKGKSRKPKKKKEVAA
jgi:large subunit ribosomal protein L5